MKRITVCLLLVLLSTPIVYAEVTKKTIGKIPDGIVREYYESGKLKAEGRYKDDKTKVVNSSMKRIIQ